MTSPSLHVRRAFLAAVASTLGAIVAPATTHAAVPDCAQSTIPRVLVGNASGNFLPPPSGYIVVVRDIGGFVIGGARVTLSFGDTPAANIRLHNAQNAGTVVNCATREVSQLSNAAGEARFGARFGGHQPAPTIDVILDGIPCIDRVIAHSTDIAIAANPAETGLADLALFAACFGNPLCQCTPAALEFDYDLDFRGACLNDFAIFGTEFLAAVQGTYCP